MQAEQYKLLPILIDRKRKCQLFQLRIKNERKSKNYWYKYAKLVVFMTKYWYICTILYDGKSLFE